MCAEQKLGNELGRWSWKWNQPITLILQGPECRNMTFKCKLCLLKDPLQQLCSAQRAEMRLGTKTLQQPPADEVKHKLESNMPKPHVISSFLHKVVISLNSVTRPSTCRLPGPHSAVCFHFSSCFVVFWGGILVRR